MILPRAISSSLNNMPPINLDSKQSASLTASPSNNKNNNNSSRGTNNKSVAYASPIKPGINTTPHKHQLFGGIPQGVDRLLLMHTVSGICQRLV